MGVVGGERSSSSGWDEAISRLGPRIVFGVIWKWEEKWQLNGLMIGEGRTKFKDHATSHGINDATSFIHWRTMTSCDTCTNHRDQQILE
jgi:hypothetical protein